MKEVFDIIIVGSGACGAAAAWSLSRDQSLKILCLEQGEKTNVSKFSCNSKNTDFSESLDYNYKASGRMNPGDYPIDDSDSSISIANFNSFGGSTILYSGHFPRMHPSDFCTFSLDGVGEDWPISYADLLPYFKLNEKMMGIAGLVGDPANPNYSDLLPPVPLGLMGRALAEGFNHLGWHWWPSYAAISKVENKNETTEMNDQSYATGALNYTSRSVDLTYWPISLKQGVEVRTQSRVVKVKLNYQGKVKGIVYADLKGAHHEVETSVLILACSGIGSPRLLLNSNSSAYPDGIGNASGILGKNLMLHPLAFIEGVFHDDLQSSIGPPGACILSQEFYETSPNRDFVRGYTLQVLRGSLAYETANKGFFMRQIPLGPEHHKKFNRIFNRNAGIAVISEDLPELKNYIELDHSNCDSSGMPGIKVHYKVSNNTRKMLMHGINSSKQVFQSAGAKVKSAFAPVKHTGWHLMGTARMGDNKNSSVVNRHCQVHDIPNLFIVDSSVFVTSGAVNPVATAQAITLWACEYISKHKNVRFS